MWKFCFYYNPKLKESDLKEEINYFKGQLNITGNFTITKQKTLKNVAYNIYINSTLLNFIMINSLNKIRNYLTKVNKNTTLKILKEFSKGYITKYMLGDGTVISRKDGLQINITESDKFAKRDVSKILLKFFNIKSSIIKNKLHLSTNFNSYFWFVENYAFVGHNYNRRKLLNYILKEFYINCLYSRLKDLSKVSVNDFATKNKLAIYIARKYLKDNSKRGFLKRINNKKEKYIITEKGLEFVSLVKNSKEELKALTFNNS